MQLDRADDQIDRVPVNADWFLNVRVDSTFRSGKQTYHLQLTIEQNGRHEQYTIPIAFSVIPGLRVLPGSLELSDLEPGERRTVKLEVADAFPGAGLVIDHIEYSGTAVAGVVWRPRPVNSPIRTFQDANQYTFKVRGQVDLTIEANSQLDVSHGSFTLIPADSARHGLEVPVSLKLQPKAVVATPDVLVFEIKEGTSLKKRFSLGLANLNATCRIITPAGIAANLIPSLVPGFEIYEVTLNVQEFDPRSNQVIKIVSETTNQELLQIPVKLLGVGK